MSHIEHCFSEETRAMLDEKTRKRLDSVEHLIQKFRGAQLLHALATHIRRYWSSCPVAVAAAMDQVSLLSAGVEEDSRFAKEIATTVFRFSRSMVRKKTPAEAKVWTLAAQVDLGGLSEAEAKRRLGEILSVECREKFSAYTQTRIARLIQGRRGKEMAFGALESLAEQASIPRLMLLARLFSGSQKSYALLQHNEVSLDILKNAFSKESLQACSTGLLVLLLGSQKQQTTAGPMQLAVRTLLEREDRTQFAYLRALASTAFTISRSSDLSGFVRKELSEHPPGRTMAPLIVAELANYGVVPMAFLAQHIKPHLDGQHTYGTFERMQILLAMATLGHIDPHVANDCFQEFLPLCSQFHPGVLLLLPDAIWAFAICDLLLNTKYAPRILSATHELLAASYREFDERARMRIARAAASADYQLPRGFRNSIRRIVHGIENSPPRMNRSEQAFVELLQSALPEAEVCAGGFVASHHLDASVRINEKRFDAELDGRFHEVYDLHGKFIGKRGEDALRDCLIEKRGVKVVRFSHEDINQPEAEELIRRRFGVDYF